MSMYINIEGNKLDVCVFVDTINLCVLTLSIDTDEK